MTFSETDPHPSHDHLLSTCKVRHGARHSGRRGVQVNKALHDKESEMWEWKVICPNPPSRQEAAPSRERKAPSSRLEATQNSSATQLIFKCAVLHRGRSPDPSILPKRHGTWWANVQKASSRTQPVSRAIEYRSHGECGNGQRCNENERNGEKRPEEGKVTEQTGLAKR